MRKRTAITNGSCIFALRKPFLVSERLRQQLARRQDCGTKCPQQWCSDRSMGAAGGLCSTASTVQRSPWNGQVSSFLFLPDNALFSSTGASPTRPGWSQPGLRSPRWSCSADPARHGTAVNGTCYASDSRRFTWTARIILKAVSRHILGNTFIRKDACQMMNQTALVKWNFVTSTRAF